MDVVKGRISGRAKDAGIMKKKEPPKVVETESLLS